MIFPKLSPWVLGLLQAAGFAAYATLFGAFLVNGSKWFGPSPSILGPVLFLLLFAFSAIVSTAMVLGYPFYVFWEKKNTELAVRLVAFTAAWLLFFIIITLTLLLFAR